MTDPAKPTLLVVDGHSLAFRAFYALPVDSFVTRDGQHTNAIHGFLSMLILLLQNEKPTHLAVAFDISRFSFRTREYAEYKGTRSETPPEFVGQVPLLEEALQAMGVQTLSKEDFEADDILATLATRGAEEGFDVLVVSGDRDAIQLVRPGVTLLYPNARGVSELKRYDRDAVVERYGIEPEQYPDVAALVGETSDNLIGIDKVGEKTAVKWLKQFGSLDEILAHADEITGVVGQNLRDQKDRAVRNRKLNRLVTDVELPVGPLDLERKPIDEQAVRAVFDRLQFKTLLERVLKIAAAERGDSAPSAADAPPADSIPVIRTLVDEELAQWIKKQSASGTTPLGLRVETHGSSVTGFGLASATETVYVPWAEGRMDYVALETWLASDAPKYLQGAKSQYKALHGAGLRLEGIAFDTTLGAWLLKPGLKPESLETQVYDYLGERLAVADPSQLVPENEGASPATEAWYILRIAEYLAGRLDAGSRGVLDDIELPLVPVLATMELTGITVNHDVLSALTAQLSETAATVAAAAFAEIGREINLGSPKQLQEVLFDQLEMPKTRSNKTGFSTDAASLADLQEQNPHPFLDLLLQHRDATKLMQIIASIDKAIDKTGRVHTTYEQAGSSTGRIASNDPNLQNVPVKTEIGRRIRSAFEPSPGFETLLTADYSQIEMRIMAHLSGDAGLIEAFNSGEDLHRFVGARIFSVAPADVTPTMRTKVKAMSYGLAYGLSAFGLSKQLRIETSEAKELMTDYFARFGAVRDYLRNVVEQAKVDGYTTTIFGRRRPFPDLNSSNRVLRENAQRQALNSPIQGSAADILKRAMLSISADMAGMQSRMLLQVHDELVFEVAPGELDDLTSLVRARMGGAADLDVPLDVQIGTGPNWDAAAH
ncbi:DNA polymerase-1 [Microbacteriaceae bacterium SG_E_30_P1]|uniref:DNA polymerase I n=1 Tax=Antiquaquibacter oligotrophicus TaxID=2880260 RepID=A0ABT6KLQ0_9MICO|nr:DNA polymerase I [Antiquaquibacter oligotrophicus]MDH6180944.1 DNA polymerase-1 [Antiquaquibacter oligotrophicus]UDF13354.1 DNA polymerase I [Antiquaquibacter oligotrophicus]